MRLDNVRLLATHFPAMFAFYRDVMQLQVTWGEPDGDFASFADASGTTCIGLFARPLMAEVVGTLELPRDAAAQDRAAIVFEVESVDAFAAHAKQAGASLITTPTDMAQWGIRTTHLRDPDGNLLEAFSHLPKEEWSEGLRSEGEREDAK